MGGLVISRLGTLPASKGGDPFRGLWIVQSRWQFHVLFRVAGDSVNSILAYCSCDSPGGKWQITLIFQKCTRGRERQSEDFSLGLDYTIESSIHQATDPPSHEAEEGEEAGRTVIGPDNPMSPGDWLPGEGSLNWLIKLCICQRK